MPAQGEQVRCFRTYGARYDGGSAWSWRVKTLTSGTCRCGRSLSLSSRSGCFGWATSALWGKSTALDVMLGIVFGSTVSRAITGNAPFFPVLAASLTLVLVHWLLSALVFRSPRFGVVVKGHARTLVRDGEILWHEMQRSHISEHDLQEALRANGKSLDLRDVESAHLERNGDISIILRKRR